MTISEIKERMEQLDYEFECCFEEFQRYQVFRGCERRYADWSYADLLEQTDCAKREFAKILDDYVTQIELFIQGNEDSLNCEELKELKDLIYVIWHHSREVSSLMDHVVSNCKATTVEDGTAVNYLSRNVQRILKNKYQKPVSRHANCLMSKVNRMIYFLNKDN